MTMRKRLRAAGFRAVARQDLRPRMPAAATRALLPSPLATVKAESPGVLKAPLTNFFSHDSTLNGWPS